MDPNIEIVALVIQAIVMLVGLIALPGARRLQLQVNQLLTDLTELRNRLHPPNEPIAPTPNSIDEYIRPYPNHVNVTV